MSKELNWLELVKLEMRKFQAGGRAYQFRSTALKLLGAPYIWGAEGPEGSDCSGTVCFPLWLMGFNIRVTADVLHKQLFTRPLMGYSEGDVQAVFYLARKEQTYGPGNVLRPGQARHVTPLVGRNVVLNAGGQVRLETAAYVRQWFEAKDCSAEWRGIDWEAAARMSESLDFAWDVDPVLTLLRGIGGAA